jgi:hypothetical protein
VSSAPWRILKRSSRRLRDKVQNPLAKGISPSRELAV